MSAISPCEAIAVFSYVKKILILSQTFDLLIHIETEFFLFFSIIIMHVVVIYHPSLINKISAD